ncbi:hypothetical protein ACLOJK_006941, partial [Asimina triloba]
MAAPSMLSRSVVGIGCCDHATPMPTLSTLMPMGRGRFAGVAWIRSQQRGRSTLLMPDGVVAGNEGSDGKSGGGWQHGRNHRPIQRPAGDDNKVVASLESTAAMEVGSSATEEISFPQLAAAMTACDLTGSKIMDSSDHPMGYSPSVGLAGVKLLSSSPSPTRRGGVVDGNRLEGWKGVPIHRSDPMVQSPVAAMAAALGEDVLR